MRKKALVALSALILTVGFFSQVQAQAYSGVDTWFEDEISRAENQWNIIPASLMDQDLSENITRGEFCEVIVLAYQVAGGKMLPFTIGHPFSDETSEAAKQAAQLGIVTGYADGTFRQNRAITRQEMFVMLYRMMRLTDEDVSIYSRNVDRTLSYFSDEEQIADWARTACAVMVNSKIVQGSANRESDPLSNTTRQQAIAMADRLLGGSGEAGFTDGTTGYTDWRRSEDDDYGGWYSGGQAEPGGDPLSVPGYTDEKYILVFGSLENERYQTSAEAFANMTTITVSVWMINTAGTKYTGQKSLTVHKAVADRVKAVFQEIYEGDEKFPIKSVGGYAWRASSTSEHRWGLAIDINPDENYMIKSDGTVVAGSFWKPGENPYSIPEDGDVVNAFHKYGFSWGGNAWRSSHDYMHFSYLGT